MKRIYLLIFLLCAVEGFGQIITESPEIDDQSSYETDIIRVELRDEFTIIYFRYQYSGSPGTDLNFPLPYQRQKPQTPSTATISINPKSYLNGNGKRFRYIKSTGIVELPDAQPVYPREVYRFKVYYERLDPGIELFNLIEGKNAPKQSLHYWNFYGVHVRNPLKKNPQSVASPVLLTIKGRLIDARTQKPISGRITYKVDNNPAKTGNKMVQANVGFSFLLKPDAYTFNATAPGYAQAETGMDLSKIRKGQQFTQDIYLSPIAKKPVPKVEIKPLSPKKEAPETKAPVIAAPKLEIPREETAPVKVDENKFRLDKVYFNTGESGLLEKSFEQLDGLLKMMKDSPTMKIKIEGHTDNVGDPEQNKRLSLQRAFNVREYLIKKGIAGNRIQFKGYGNTKPITDNDTEENRKKNRRVEFIIQTP